VRNPPPGPGQTAASVPYSTVVFNFDGALELARRLAALAEEFEATFSVYGAAADAALAVWSGPHRDRAAGRVVQQRRSSAATVRSLRSEADRWAQAWASAADDARRERWVAAATRGQDGPPLAAPAPVEVPHPPGYLPTADPMAELAAGGWS
jgi:hypothetical protein